MEASVPVWSPVRVDDDIVARDFPGGKVASAIHRGPYEELGIAYRELGKWMSENGYQPRRTLLRHLPKRSVGDGGPRRLRDEGLLVHQLRQCDARWACLGLYARTANT
jgi:hypothetical protein